MDRLESVVQKVLVDFPALEAAKNGDELQIHAREAGEDGGIVGTYSHEGYESGQISEQDIREDCEAFLSEVRR